MFQQLVHFRQFGYSQSLVLHALPALRGSQVNQTLASVAQSRVLQYASAPPAIGSQMGRPPAQLGSQVGSDVPPAIGSQMGRVPAHVGSQSSLGTFVNISEGAPSGPPSLC